MNNTEIRGLESVHRIKAIESTYEARAVKQDIVYLRQKALLLQRNAVLTGDWSYYAQLLDIQDRIRCHKKLLEKYPYDGKSPVHTWLISVHQNNFNRNAFRRNPFRRNPFRLTHVIIMFHKVGEQIVNCPPPTRYLHILILLACLPYFFSLTLRTPFSALNISWHGPEFVTT